MKLKFLFPAALLFLVAISCKDPVDNPPVETTDSFEGLVVNEVCPAKSLVKEAWLEIYNPGEKAVNLKGLKVVLTGGSAFEDVVATLDGGLIEPSGFFVISTKEIDFEQPMLMATFEEVGIADADGASVNSFSLKYDFSSSKRIEEGESYARIPDGTGDWFITGTPTPGESNYRIIPHKIENLVFNEISPAQGWVELVNAGTKVIQLEYSYLETKSGKLLYRAPGGLEIPVEGRIVAQCENFEASDFSELVYKNNSDAKVVSFSAGNLQMPDAEGSWSRLPDITGNWKSISTNTKGEVNASSSSSDEGLVINEVSPTGGWIEIANSTVENITSSGVVVKCDGNKIWESGRTTIGAGKKVSFSTSVSSSSTYTLCSAGGDVLDTFKAADVKDKRSCGEGFSWSRIPDGTGNFYTVKTPSRDQTNYGITEHNTIAIWVNHSSMGSIDLEKMCRLGIGNIVIHEFVFRTDYHTRASTEAFFKQAHDLGMTVHIWLQCFWWNDDEQWRCPVIDATSTSPARYNQPLFDEVINRALSYLPYEIDGIHFDYIRFPGTAYKHSFPSDGITGSGAITEFARQAATKIRAKRPDIILSAAMMGEKAAVNYYGQDPEQMNPYIDVFMPMAYISSYGYTSAANVAVADWFANRAGNSEVWHGLSTYNSSTQGLSAAQIYDDCKNIVDNSKADGIALFRYGLGTLPDMNAFYK